MKDELRAVDRSQSVGLEGGLWFVVRAFDWGGLWFVVRAFD